MQRQRCAVIANALSITPCKTAAAGAAFLGAYRGGTGRKVTSRRECEEEKPNINYRAGKIVRRDSKNIALRKEI